MLVSSALLFVLRQCECRGPLAHSCHHYCAQTAGKQEQEALKAMADRVMVLVNEVMRRTEQQLSDSSRILQVSHKSAQHALLVFTSNLIQILCKSLSGAKV